MKPITNKISNICKCGCGKRVSRPDNKYISGHNRKLPKEIRTCVCGCNRTFECKIKSKRIYITGHNRRIHPFPKSVLCKCGCGQLTKPGNKSINGHNNRRKDYLKETRVSKCLCGCNKLTSPGSKYIWSHYNNPSEETKKKISKSLTGKKHPRWLGGISKFPYAFDFNKELKFLIRRRDKHICQLCRRKRISKNLCVHHIDYDKQNSNPKNLITLCISCNSKVNTNRKLWAKFFNQKLKLLKVI